jgi:hypothetical protein
MVTFFAYPVAARRARDETSATGPNMMRRRVSLEAWVGEC